MLCARFASSLPPPPLTPFSYLQSRLHFLHPTYTQYFRIFCMKILQPVHILSLSIKDEPKIPKMHLPFHLLITFPPPYRDGMSAQRGSCFSTVIYIYIYIRCIYLIYQRAHWFRFKYTPIKGECLICNNFSLKKRTPIFKG